MNYNCNVSECACKKLGKINKIIMNMIKVSFEGNYEDDSTKHKQHFMAIHENDDHLMFQKLFVL